MNDTKRTELVKQIKQAFKKEDFPGRKIGEKEELRDFLGKSWKEVTIDEINGNWSFLFFNDAGLRYYLQAYLIAILEHPDQINSFVREAVLRELGYNPMSMDICQIFSKKQRLVLLAFFELYAELFPISIRSDFSAAQMARIQKERDELHSQIEQAISYWQSCI